MEGESDSLQPEPSARFATTRWSLVVRANAADVSEAESALETLCEAYWYPLYAFARRRGHSAHDAMDHTQAFFARVLEKDYLHSADQQRGRFRSFLLTMFKRFLSKEHDRATAQKRGGPRRLLSLDVDSAEKLYRREPATEQTPERIFERRWALLLLERALSRLEAEYAQKEKLDLFARLRVYLTGDGGGTNYAAVAESLAMSEGAIKVAVHRLRQRYRDVLCDEVAQTVAREEDIEEELQALRRAIRG